MGLMKFLKEAGEKLFGQDSPMEVQGKIQAHIEKQGLGLEQLSTSYNSETETVTLRGYAPNIAAYEKAAITAGNIKGVAHVENLIRLRDVNGSTVAAPVDTAAPAHAGAENAPATESDSATTEPVSATRYHDVVKGDTLSAIAKKYYGNANDYQKIFEANKPMLSHPDKIYVGQKLRIPE